ncbi:PREDICTED: CAP-Gly domain-containing linker protein 2 [Ceratosolen solmsi marchali]|uniref:CAP-Gly domain-containing linker protein 2 n=1 Tax=Ceratosolen solmsi marchali TaxID=326594 RepID=A0AAJ6YK45_9HYME|nr:PREDICTED: CAP-Gly domain-containing linker protein 2 [Ceratosolen solmsi marchali]
MSEIKPSGIRPPSKIDRPTCSVTPKPSLPPRSINPMEPLWETHGRRLSEAGVRRGSDNSVVLTEDTDSFIIGEHVWVGGTKPGQIAYIGETQFAPGDWAGIVLDEPIGKNDGSVAGCRYFQCEPKRGIFSRLTRLTRQPMSGGLTSPSGIVSPIESIKGVLNKSMSPCSNTSTTSLSSVSQKELQIGERVIVSSSQGSKTGFLRYIGTTEFAPGDWCGVELDEPLGKNDGSVNDKRYFECRPKYGLFAPMQKVSRSPSSRRSHCLVHRPTGAALSKSLRKVGSRESLASVASIASVASRATNATARLQKAGFTRTTTPVQKTTQDILKEKLKEIDTLRKERDLERERVTKAANQADEAEKIVMVLKKEYEKYREETEKLSQDTQENLIKLFEEKNLLLTQLEEERTKCEDLLFRFEEESINKADIQVANSLYENKINDLEKQLSEERERVIQLERDTTRLFETEEELTKLRIQTQNATTEEADEFSNLQKCNEKLEKTELELKNLLEDKTKIMENHILKMNEIHEKLKGKEKENLVQEEFNSNLNKKLEETTKQLEKKSAYIDELSNQFKVQTEILQKKNEQLKETMQKVTEHNTTERMKLIETHEKILKENDEIRKSQASAFKQESEKLTAQKNILENFKMESDRQIQELSESFQSQLSCKDSQIKEISTKLCKKMEEADSLAFELNKLRIKYKNEIEIITQEKSKLENHITSLTEEINILTDKLNKSDENNKVKDCELSKLQSSKIEEITLLQKEFQEQIEIRNKCIQDITETASQKSIKLNLNETELSDLKLIIENQNEQIKNLSEKTSELQDTLSFSEQTISNLESELLIYENNLMALTEKCKKFEDNIVYLTNQKEKLREEISHIISTSEDSSDKLIRYNEQFRQKEKELDETKHKEFELRQSLIAAESKTSMLEQDLNKITLIVSELEKENEKIKVHLKLEIQEKQNITEKFTVSQTIEQDLLNKNKVLEDNLKKQILELSNLTNVIKTVEERNSFLERELADTFEKHKIKKYQLEKQISEGGNDQIILKENIDTLEKLNAQLLCDQQAMDISMKEVKENLNTKNQHVLQLESLVNTKDLQLNEIINSLEILKIEKEKIKQNLLEINVKYNDALTELNILKSSNTNLESQMALEIANLKQQLEDEKNTLDTALKESKNYLDELTKELTIVSENGKKSNQRCCEMESIIISKDREIQILNENLISEKKNNEISNQQLQTFQDNIVIKSNEILSNINFITSLNENIKNLESDIRILKTDLENKTKIIVKLENTIYEIKKSKANNDSSNIEEKQKEMDELIKKHKHELELKDSIILEISNALENKEKIVNEFSKKNVGSEELCIKYENDLALKDKTIDNLKNSEETAKKAVEDYKDKQKIIDSLIIKHENDLKLKDKFILELQQTKREMEERIQNFIEQINYAHKKCANLEESQTYLEKENKQLLINYNETIAKLNITNENFKNSTNNDILKHNVIENTEENTKSILHSSESEFEKLKEEYDLAKGQIDFLNSVIVDMQHKNEALSCKIQVLEMGIPTQEADDYNLNLIEKKVQPLRMFCDICDQFDIHETEDCPKQAQDPDPIKPKSDKKIPIQRPYCENCEMFGHDTMMCDKTETY